MTARRNSLSIGKEGELRVIGELLRQGFMVYLPVVDTEGTDCIIKNKATFIGIQVKTRESARILLFDVRRFKPRDNFFIVCYSTKEPNDFWVLPSRVYAEYARPVNKKTKLRLVLGADGSRMRQRLHIFRNNFHQLRNVREIAARSEDRRAVKQTTKRVTGWARLKRLYPTVEAVETKIKQASAAGVSPGYLKVLENLKRYWERRR